MKALLGLDRFNDGRPILDLFARLGFEDCRVTLAHAVDAMMPAAEMPAPEFSVVHNVDSMKTAPNALALNIERAANKALDHAREVLYASGIHSEMKLLYGSPAAELIQEADSIEADLIGAGSETQGPVQSVVLGSICRALTIGAHKSVLIAKQPTQPDKLFTAVLATDHSAYCNQAIDKLMEFNPMGIQRLILVTAVETDVEADEQVQRSESIVARFKDLNIMAEAVIHKLPVVEAINKSMEDAAADLLIVAAHGHGFMERFALGSVSLHEAVAEPYSLLILRP